MGTDEFLPIPDVKSESWVPFRKAGPFVFLSSQTGVREDGTYSREPEEQMRHAYENFDNVLKQAGIAWKDVVQVTMCVSDRYYLDDAIRLRDEFFGTPIPAITCLFKEFGHPNHILNLKGIAYIEEQ